MKRREVMLAAVAAGSLGLTDIRRHRGSEPLDLNVWFSEAAVSYDSLRQRIETFASASFGEANRDVHVTFNERPVSLPSEDGMTLMTRTWPSKVLGEAIGRGEIGDVNLLVTDGDPRLKPAGYAMRSIATISGARYLARMTPFDETPTIVDYSAPAAIVQLLLHECGHAVGLTHRHGSVTVRENEVIASPMIGAYAWRGDRTGDGPFPSGHNVCGHSVATSVEAGTKHRLALRYSRCAHRAIGRYRGVRLG